MKKSVCIFTFLMLTAISYSQDNMKTFDPNYVHTVFFWFNNPDNEVDQAHFEASLKKFLKNSKFAKTNFIGKAPKATRDVVDDSFTYKLVVTFDSAEAQQGYQEEDAHLIFIEECKDLWKKVIVYDAQGI
ncbi:Dabb family protein [Poritiphilus flavus]|uniref:Dabb family protein n=1 Tax=Poritiphilus flavus TaxID=2697053 RepID=A0A6L9E6Y2_9FLAO|nr:Dabb family protein [Poritiphilus flavus]NAS10450.1 Dabb family protein [Poritiphilus flavus]